MLHTCKPTIKLTDVAVKAHSCEYHYKGHDPRKVL